MKKGEHFSQSDVDIHPEKIMTYISRKQDYSPAEFLKLFCVDNTLEKLLSIDAGVSEGYSVFEHTELVLKMAEQYHAQLIEYVQPLLTWGEFRLFLALHDIGKGLAYQENEQDVFKTSLTFKRRELAQSRKVVRAILSKLNFTAEKTRLFVALLKNDTIGTLLNGEISLDEAFDHILEQAHVAEVAEIDFTRLFVAFHMVDAGSYPSLRYNVFTRDDDRLCYQSNSQKKLDELLDQAQLISQGKEKFTELCHTLRNSSAKEANISLLKQFISAVPAIKTYIIQQNHQLLTCKDCSDEKLQDQFRNIKRKTRMLLLNLARHYVKPEHWKDFVKRYVVITNREFGLRKFNFHGSLDTMDSLFLSYVIKPYIRNGQLIDLDYTKSTEFSIQFMELFDELMAFRRNYLMRYKFTKVEQKIRQFRNPNTDSGLSEKTLNTLAQVKCLMDLTFLHGSKSCVWPNLLLTSFRLVPSGRLRRLGITPFSGELENGVGHYGINAHSLSGVTLDGTEDAWRYAKDSDYQTSLDREKKGIDYLLKKDLSKKNFEIKYDCTWHNGLIRKAVSIQRLRVLDPEYFEQHKQNLLEAAQVLRDQFEQFKSTDDYKNAMPKSDDPDGSLGFGWHDYYWKYHIVKMEFALDNWIEACTNSLHSPPGVQSSLQNTYPMLFASRTLRSPIAIDFHGSEHKAIRAAKLGKDLQVLVVEQDDIDDAEKLLANSKLTDRIKVYPVDDLLKASKFNMAASPYLADLLSHNHLGKDNYESDDKKSSTEANEEIIVMQK